MSTHQTHYKPQFNRSVLMSGAQFMSNQLAINPYMDTGQAFDTAKAVEQHAQIRHALESIGIEVTTCDAPPDCQDGVFTANEALLGPDNQTMLMARLPYGRDAETPYYEKVLQDNGKTILLLPDPDWYFSGQGDALRYGNYLLTGQKFRTTPGPVVHQYIHDSLGYDIVSLQAVSLNNSDGTPSINSLTGLPNSEFYDIDYAVAPVRWPTDEQPGLLVACRAALEPASQAELEALPNTIIIWASYQEATAVSACNLVATGEAVVMNAGAPQLQQALQEHDLHVVTVDTSELQKNGGSVRCTTLTLSHI